MAAAGLKLYRHNPVIQTHKVNNKLSMEWKAENMDNELCINGMRNIVKYPEDAEVVQ